MSHAIALPGGRTGVRTEEELRAAAGDARRHDPDAWEQLYRHCHPGMLAYAARRLPTRQAAEDAVSETFARAIDRIERFSWRDAGIVGWLYGILRNVVFEHQRFERRGLRGAPPDAALTADPLEEVLGAEELATVRAAFARLDPDDQELLELRIVAGLAAKEVATVLGRRAGAVRMAQSRALGRLRAGMGQVV